MKRSAALLLAASLAVACAQQVDEDVDQDHSHEAETDHQDSAEILPATIMPETEFAPEYIQHATGIKIIPDITEGLESPSNTFTHEGNFGPLLFGENIRSFYIRLEPGMFLAEHPHATESLVFTVSGTWVLCSEGKRQVMEAGSTFHFGSDIPTGWEAPFPEGALLYIVKSYADMDYESYSGDIRTMAADLDQQLSEGSEFYFHQLPADHEAIQFARQHNPDFDEILELRY